MSRNCQRIVLQRLTVRRVAAQAPGEGREEVAGVGLGQAVADQDEAGLARCALGPSGSVAGGCR